MLTLNDVELNSILAPVQWGYSPAGFYARKFLPVVEVKKPTGKFVKFDASHLRHIKSASEGAAPAPLVDIGASLTNFTCSEHARAAFIPDFVSREMGNDIALPFAQMAQESLLVEEERALAAAMNTTGNFVLHTNYDTPTTLWDQPNADPFSGAYGVKWALSYLYGANGNRRDAVIMAVTPDVHLVLADFVRATTPQAAYPLPVEQEMARYFGVREYCVLDSSYNSAVMGQADSLAGCFGTKQCWLATVPADQNILTPSFGKTIVDVPGSKVINIKMQDPEGDKIVLKNSYYQATIAWSQMVWIKDCIS